MTPLKILSKDIVGLMWDHNGSSALAQERSCWDLA